jgi:hypothetical protein
MVAAQNILKKPKPYLTAILQLETFRRHETGIPMKPTAEQGVLGKRSGGAGEVCKHNLGDILSQMCISTDQAERGAIDQADIAPDQFPESWFGAVLDVFGEQCLAVCHLQFSDMPDVYIARAGVDSKDIDERFTQTELGKLKVFTAIFVQLLKWVSRCHH